jgi:hypothetical protein
MKHLGSLWTNFHEIWYLRIFRKSVEKIQVSLKSDKNKGLLYVKSKIHFWSYLVQSFLEWEIFQTKICRENQNTHFVISRFFFRKSYSLWDNVEKYCREQQNTYDCMAHAHFMLDNWGYKCTHRLWNTDCFSIATMVVRMRLNVTLYVHCLSCFVVMFSRKEYFEGIKCAFPNRV